MLLFSASLRADDKMIMQSKWPMGRLHYGTAEPDSIRYVAQYIDKNIPVTLLNVNTPKSIVSLCSVFRLLVSVDHISKKIVPK